MEGPPRRSDTGRKGQDVTWLTGRLSGGVQEAPMTCRPLVTPGPWHWNPTPLLRSESEISFIPTGCVSRWSSFKIFVFVWPMTWMGTDLQAAIPPDCQKETLQVGQSCVPKHDMMARGFR